MKHKLPAHQKTMLDQVLVWCSPLTIYATDSHDGQGVRLDWGFNQYHGQTVSEAAEKLLKAVIDEAVRKPRIVARDELDGETD